MTQDAAPPKPTLPTVDFTKDMVLVAATGPEPSTGYSIAIVSAYASGSTMTVNVQITSPGANCAVGYIVTSPFDLATTALRNGAVQFAVTRVAKDCSQ